MPIFSIVIVCAINAIGCPLNGAVYSHIEANTEQHCVDSVRDIIRRNDHLDTRMFIISCSRLGA